MESPIKGGYILISLGLIALSASAELSNLDYERITKTKKHIVLTGIKVGSEVMPDVCVEPIIGEDSITFSDVYGFDIVVSSDNTVEVVEHEQTPNVEDAQSGTSISMLGLDSDGKVVKSAIPSSGTKLYRHSLTISAFGTLTNSITVTIISTKDSSYTSIVQSDLDKIVSFIPNYSNECTVISINFIRQMSGVGIILLGVTSNNITSYNATSFTISSDSVTAL